jgi:hypothetical protein
MQNSSAECEPIRANNRIQIFDQDGKFTAGWKQFGRPSGLFIDQHDILHLKAKG